MQLNANNVVCDIPITRDFTRTRVYVARKDGKAVGLAIYSDAKKRVDGFCAKDAEVDAKLRVTIAKNAPRVSSWDIDRTRYSPPSYTCEWQDPNAMKRVLNRPLPRSAVEHTEEERNSRIEPRVRGQSAIFPNLKGVGRRLKTRKQRTSVRRRRMSRRISRNIKTDRVFVRV